MPGIAANLQAVRARIAAAERESGRAPGSASLLAVSKTFSPADMREAFLAGQRAFGESYLQEAQRKFEVLRDLPIEWHYIGPLQSNKTRQVAQLFHWVHSIDREKIAQRLAEQRPADAAPLNICLQVNLSGEASKSGVAADALAQLVQAVVALPRLRLRGLMCIPEPSDDAHLLRARFQHLRALRDCLNRDLQLSLDTLSMGMSSDLEIAVAEGATVLRVGTAIFGARALDHDGLPATE